MLTYVMNLNFAIFHCLYVAELTRWLSPFLHRRFCDVSSF